MFPIGCVGSVFGPCFAMHYKVSFLVLQSSRAGCFTLSSWCCVTVSSVALPHGAVGWSDITVIS